jgi:electron transfer flavoprotein beta subunit
MKIVVAVKQVPDTESRIRINSDGTGIITDELTYVVNPYDEYAVEEAILIREKMGDGQVTVVGLGPEQAKDALRSCLAVGADDAVHLMDPKFEGGDTYATAVALAAALKTMEYDLILCGKQAVDDGAHFVGAALAQLLDLPQITQVTKLEISEDGKSATAHREVEGGSEVIETSLPAVITAEKGLNEPRYAPLKGIMQAKKKEIKVLDADALGLDAGSVGEAGSKTKVTSYYSPPERPPGRIIEGEVADAVKELVKLLREEAKVV